MTGQFAVSAGLMARLQRYESRATQGITDQAGIADVNVETFASNDPTTFLRLPDEVLADEAVLYARFGESSGSVAADIAGGFNGAYAGAVTLGVAPGVTYLPPVEQDTAIHIGPGGSVTFAHNPAFDFDFDDQFTIEMWLRRNGPPSSVEVLLNKGGGGVRSYRARLLTNGRVRFDRTDGAGGPQIDSAASVCDNSWRYIVLRRVGDNLVLNVDSLAPVTTPDTTTGTTSNSGDLVFGEASSNVDLDELAVYDVDLTDEQVVRHYKAGRGIPL